MKDHRPVVLSYGLGVDSTAILLRWLTEPASRDFDLSQLTVITAMTGDEWEHTKADVEAHVLPLLREHRIRYVQVARSQALVRKDEGVVVLSDTDQPDVVHLDGAYRLSEEMLAAGTVPQSAGSRRCSAHAKGWPLDATIPRLTNGRPYRHVVGFEANEPGRANKDALFNTALRTGEYPLIEWGWDRETCIEYIRLLTDVTWHKSACVYCPFSIQNKAGLARQLELYRQHPLAGVQALFMEEVSLALNPLQGLIPRDSLGRVLAAAEMHEVLALTKDRLNATPHALYDVRRILRPRKNDRTKMANSARAIRRLATGTRSQMVRQLEEAGGNFERDGFWRAHIVRRGDALPAAEHFLAVAPAVVHDKQQDRFEDWWREIAIEQEERVA